MNTIMNKIKQTVCYEQIETTFVLQLYFNWFIIYSLNILLFCGRRIQWGSLPAFHLIMGRDSGTKTLRFKVLRIHDTLKKIIQFWQGMFHWNSSDREHEKWKRPSGCIGVKGQNAFAMFAFFLLIAPEFILRVFPYLIFGTRHQIDVVRLN